MADSSYFKRIPRWTGNRDGFDILADKISGRIPVTRLESWKDFDDVVRHGIYGNKNMIYRGQRRFDWGLDPTLARVASKSVISERLALNQLALFRGAVRGRISDYGLVAEDATDELWSLGQHHGLLTPLLDWTHSPYVALFFAFFREDPEEEEDNPYRVVYALNKEFVGDDELCPNIRLVEPRRDDYGRLVNQAGLFTFSPYDSTIEAELANSLADESFPDDDLRVASEDEQAALISKYLCKIYIKNDGQEREECLKHLRRMNVHHASLFPDLMGASEHCNLLVAEEQKDYELQKTSEEIQRRLEEADRSDEDLWRPHTGQTYSTASLEHYVSILSEFIDDPEFSSAQVRSMAAQIEEAVNRHQVVDWDQRDSALARMRNALRVILRKYSYPNDKREPVIKAIEEFTVNFVHEMESSGDS